MTRENLSAARCISDARGLEAGEPYYINESNPVYTRDGVPYVDVYNLKREWIGMAPRRAFSVLKTKEQALKIFHTLTSAYPHMETIYEDAIVKSVGEEGLYTLRQYHMIETCGNFDGRKLYAI